MAAERQTTSASLCNALAEPRLASPSPLPQGLRRNNQPIGNWPGPIPCAPRHGCCRQWLRCPCWPYSTADECCFPAPATLTVGPRRC